MFPFSLCSKSIKCNYLKPSGTWAQQISGETMRRHEEEEEDFFASSKCIYCAVVVVVVAWWWWWWWLWWRIVRMQWLLYCVRRHICGWEWCSLISLYSLRFTSNNRKVVSTVAVTAAAGERRCYIILLAKYFHLLPLMKKEIRP